MSFNIHRAELLAADERTRSLAAGLNDALRLAQALEVEQALILAIASLAGRAEGCCMPDTTRRRYEVEQESP